MEDLLQQSSMIESCLPDTILTLRVTQIQTDHLSTKSYTQWCLEKGCFKSNQSILKKINLEYSLEGPMVKLKLQYFRHLMRRANLLEKTLDLGRLKAKEVGGRG